MPYSGIYLKVRIMRHMVENKNKFRENCMPGVYVTNKIFLLTLTLRFLITKVKKEIQFWVILSVKPKTKTLKN